MEYLKELNNNETVFHKFEYVKYCVFIFILGGLFGCVAEYIFTGLYIGLWHKPGFLYGPFVPIYGWGALLVFIFLKRFKKNPLVFAVMTMSVTGLLEGLTGYIMFKIWKKRWWDYSLNFLNIGGYVCLFSVSLFALAGLLFIYVIEPLLNRMYTKLSKKQVNIICIVFFIIYLIDNIFAFAIKNQI